ncbi:MAG: pyridoxal-phosphate dependent enzyme [Deltaproteobacteria bacterium]|jgi:threonine synthase|nr:pyridoxal-phosphate dependent enzyme [Deltaproteobacteria bacterium]
MLVDDFPVDLKPFLIPEVSGELGYDCLSCGARHAPDQLLYTCPACGGLLMLTDKKIARLQEKPGSFWRRLFDHRLMLNLQALKGVFTFHEFLAPNIPLSDIIYLGEGHSPVVKAPSSLANQVGANFFVKMEGQNPSASFKDRGMAAALSMLNYLVRIKNLDQVIAVCASTGDTSAAAALYASSLGQSLKSVVLLPKGKVTPQQLSQPLGAGATVFELPGVFDDSMKVVERLSEKYHVALLNSKNPWRVVGQESYAYEVAQQFDYALLDKVLIVPVGNAGNITAILSGLLKFHKAMVIDGLPKIVAVQSQRANPVFRFFRQPLGSRTYCPVVVKPSVAQAAMIGDPVSFPRLDVLSKQYEQEAGLSSFFVVEVDETAIMEGMLQANRHGLTVCTQGGECLAGLKAALGQGLITPSETAILDSTAHALKFVDFQNAYFEGRLAQEYGVTTKAELANKPRPLILENTPIPEPGQTLTGAQKEAFVEAATQAIAQALTLVEKV